MSITTIA